MEVCISEELRLRHPDLGPLVVGVDFFIDGPANKVLETGINTINIRYVQRPTLDGGFEDCPEYDAVDIAERAADSFVDRYVYDNT